MLRVMIVQNGKYRFSVRFGFYSKISVRFSVFDFGFRVSGLKLQKLFETFIFGFGTETFLKNAKLFKLEFSLYFIIFCSKWYQP